MTRTPYPTTVAEIETWRKAHAATSQEARRRFVQYLVLVAIGKGELSSRIAFKGGNALRFVFNSPRSTLDLDFSALAQIPDDEAGIRAQFDAALAGSRRRFGVRVRMQSIRRRPAKRPESTWPTYELTIAYQLPGDRHFAEFDRAGLTISEVVKVELSLNEEVCETQGVPFADGTLRVCSLEDIAAEKLRALLQQPVRNRTRSQDVFDIARAVRTDADRLDLEKVSRFLITKASARGISATRSAFDEDVRDRALADYGRIEHSTGAEFIPFAEAWGLVLGLVGRLDIPA